MKDTIKTLEEDLKGWQDATKSAKYAIEHGDAHEEEFDLALNKRIEQALSHSIEVLKLYEQAEELPEARMHRKEEYHSEEYFTNGYNAYRTLAIPVVAKLKQRLELEKKLNE